MTEFFRQAGVPLATLARFDISTESLSTSLEELPAEGFIRGAIAVDRNGAVWMAWGKTLYRYDPSSSAGHSWFLPAPINVAVDPLNPVFDGNIVDMAIAQDQEVWVIAHGVRAAYGFNPSTSAWDRTVALPLGPRMFSHLAFSNATTLIVDGVVPGPKSLLAIVSTTTGHPLALVDSVRDFALTGNDYGVIFDDSNSAGFINLSNGNRTMLNLSVPVLPQSDLSVDRIGTAWFMLSAIGVGKLASGSTSYVAYPLPEIISSDNTIACGKPPCKPGTLVRIDPQLQSITFDGAGDVWVTTSLSGIPLYELTGAD